MSTAFIIETEFASIPLEKFEAHLNHPKLNEMLQAGMGFQTRKLLSRKDCPDGSIKWCFLVTKGGELPAPLKKILKEDTFSWQEQSCFIPAEHCIHWEILPMTKLVKFSGSGVWRLAKAGKGCRRLIEGKIDVAIPIVGKVVEKVIVDELKRAYEIEPSIQEKFFASLS